MKSRIFGILAGVAFVLLALAVAVWLLFVRPLEQAREAATQGVARVYADGKAAAAAVGEALSRVLGAVLPTRHESTNGPALRWEATNICEVAFARDQWTWSHRYSTTWQGSTKSLVLRAGATVKSGFDLSEGANLTVDEGQRKVRVVFPRAKILSVELGVPEPVSQEDGWWNKLDANDYAAAMREMQADAMQRAQVSDVRARAERWLQQQVALSAPVGWTVELVLAEPEPVVR